LAALYKKLIVLCFELRSDFGLDQAELQQLMSGEPMSIPVKFRTAIPGIVWEAALAAAGNMTADWADTNGAMSRRWAVVEFGKPVAKGDPRLMAEIQKELPQLLQKCNRAYREKVKKCGHITPWTKDADGRPMALPQYFHDQAAKLKKSLNSIMSFVTESGMLVRRGALGDPYTDAEYYISWEEFCEEFLKYCKTTGSRKLNLASEDSYLSTFTELQLTREHRKLPDYNAGNHEKVTFWVIGCRLTSSFIQQEASDVRGATGGAMHNRP
jgi:hypothetical protein